MAKKNISKPEEAPFLGEDESMLLNGFWDVSKGKIDSKEFSKIKKSGIKKSKKYDKKSSTAFHSNPHGLAEFHPSERAFPISESLKQAGKKAGNSPISESLKEAGEKGGNYVNSLFRSFLAFCAIFIFIGIMASLAFTYYAPKPSWHWGVESPHLTPTSSLMLKQGQQWEYTLASGNLVQKTQLGVLATPSCPGIIFADLTNSHKMHGSLQDAMQKDPGVYAICIGSDGYEIDSNKNRTGNILEFSNASWPYFAPWMLALNDNFQLNANRTLTVMPANYTVIYPFSINVTGSAKIFGRDAYVVATQTDLAQPIDQSQPAPPLTLYIDKEYRVLLEADYKDAKLVLSSAPFALANSSN